ncbi:MAG: hypothetical protein CHACPFDD_03719 [Phycisphaerae bacterium]|nr:hypothetical protein [Phycisphaerae bacterium]
MSAPDTRFIAPAAALAQREIVRFLRQRSRVIGALATPLVFWLVIGSGLGESFRPPGLEQNQNYLTYFFPGAVMLIVLFTSIFSCISIIEDRREGFLQSVLVAPVHPAAIVAGKLAGNTVLALAHAALFLMLAPLAHVPLTLPGVSLALASLTLAAVGLGAIGFVFAWRLDSVQGFHAIMNLLLFPMWLLSGALFPASGAHVAVRMTMAINPLRYAVSALRRSLFGGPHAAQVGEPGLLTCWLALTLTVAATMWLAARSVARPRRGSA